MAAIKSNTKIQKLFNEIIIFFYNVVTFLETTYLFYKAIVEFLLFCQIISLYA